MVFFSTKILLPGGKASRKVLPKRQVCINPYKVSPKCDHWQYILFWRAWMTYLLSPFLIQLFLRIFLYCLCQADNSDQLLLKWLIPLVLLGPGSSVASLLFRIPRGMSDDSSIAQVATSVRDWIGGGGLQGDNITLVLDVNSWGGVCWSEKVNRVRNSDHMTAYKSNNKKVMSILFW